MIRAPQNPGFGPPGQPGAGMRGGLSEFAVLGPEFARPNRMSFGNRE
jgi:hypothetical protein